MMKEQINMELVARIFLIVSISSLILYLAVEGLNILPSPAQLNSELDGVTQLGKDQRQPLLDETEEAFGLDEAEEAQDPVSPLVLDKAKEAFSPTSSLDEPKEAFGPVLSADLAKAKEAPSPVSSSVLHDAKEALDPVSSLDEPKEMLGPVSQAQDQIDSLIAVETEAEVAPASSPFLAEAQKSSSPVSSPISNEGKEAPSPTSLLDGISLSSVLDEAQKALRPVSSSIVEEAEVVLSPISSSIFGSATEAPSPVSSSSLGDADEAVAPTIAKGEEATTPVSYPNSPSSSPALAPAPSVFFDHDIALAIESRIKQGQADSQLAMDEAKKLLHDPKIASSETGKCLSKCVDKYATSLNQLNRAITNLGVRDVTLLGDDFGAVEADISACQACFTENIGEDSPLKALEEATAKAARECLTVMDYTA